MDIAVPHRQGGRGGLRTMVWGRAFTTPETTLFERAIAGALCDVVGPVLRPHVEGRRILDVGCGGGRLAAALAEDGGSSVVGLDPSRSQLETFARRLPEHGEAFPVRGTAEHLPFPDDRFDGVVSSCAWKHWVDPTRGVAECLRVVRPGGRVAMVEVDGSAGHREMRAFAARTRVPRGLKEAYTLFTMWSVVALAPSAEALRASFEDLGTCSLEVTRVPGLPFLAAVATRR